MADKLHQMAADMLAAGFTWVARSTTDVPATTTPITTVVVNDTIDIQRRRGHVVTGAFTRTVP